MKKTISLLLIIGCIVALMTLSCKKDDGGSSSPKVFSMSTGFELNLNTGTFKGTFENPDGLTELFLLLKKDTLDYERHDISFNNKGFSLTINDLDFSTYSYHYEYVLSGETKTTTEKTFSVLVGRWKTADGGHYEVYNADGTGHMWDPADDVYEDEADTFDWTIEGSHMTQIVHFQGGQGDDPQYCNILILSESTFKYNNDWLRAEYNLIRE